MKGINDSQIAPIADMTSQKGAYMQNIKNLIPAEGSRFEKLKAAPQLELDRVREVCSKNLKQMYHCQQCRADAVGLLSQDRFKEFY